MFVGNPWDILYNELVNSFYIVCGYMTFVTKKFMKIAEVKSYFKKDEHEDISNWLRWSCIWGAQFHEGCRLKEYLHRPNDLFCLPANQLLHWKSIYIKANQNVVGLQSTSLSFHFFKMLYRVARLGVKIIWIWDLAQMKLFFSTKFW